MAVPYTREFLQRACDAWHRLDKNTAALGRELGRPRASAQHVVQRFQEEGLTPLELPKAENPNITALVESLRSELTECRQQLAQAVKPKFTIRQDFTGSSETIFALVMGDAHDDPSIKDKTRFELAGKYCREKKHDLFISIGDFLNLNSCCFHIPNENYSGRAKGTFLADIASGREAFDAVNSGLGSWKPERHKVMGNHENRFRRVEETSPESYGMYISLYEEMMKHAGFTYSPYGAFTFYGGVGFTHVPLTIMGKPFGGKNPETQIGNDSMFDIISGHTHTPKKHVARKINQNHVTIVNAGCFLPYGHYEDFALHTPGGWDWGLTEVIIQNGKIRDYNWVSLKTLEERYEKAS